MNYYVLLGIPTDADQETIRSAFRALVRRYHPDAGEGSSADTFRQIVEAYATLTDPERRRRYDRSLHTARLRISPRIEPLDMPSGMRPVWPAPIRPVPADPRRTTWLDDLTDDLFESMDYWLSWGSIRRRY